MSQWKSSKAKRVLAALLRIGWKIKREAKGSHRILAHPELPPTKNLLISNNVLSD
ncbi:MAG: type II toxin-antitoxin system HicA family toxin [Crocosphaera sp.]|nr:type II toxin-antitoxin system HicA family toxin [Crocosphaera sp.]